MYGNLVWHFCSKKSVIKIEKINRKALRMVVNDYTLSYTDVLSTMKRCPLYVTRLKSMATEMFMSMTHNSPIFIENLFTVTDTSYDLRGGKTIFQPPVETTTFGLKLFRYEGAKLWNNLPSQMKCASSLNDFTVLVKQRTGPTCRWGSSVLCDINQLWSALRYACLLHFWMCMYLSFDLYHIIIAFCKHHHTISSMF